MWLRVSFPSGRYYAARAEDPAMPEWPPHPSRIFSGLVAAAYRSIPGMTAKRRAVLMAILGDDAPAAVHGHSSEVWASEQRMNGKYPWLFSAQRER